jgi:pyruvate/2-oxoglutarate dehydrogenase complex dihydrolipoamide acyltransferase (E2) component
VVIEATRGAIEYADAKGINLERSGIQGSGKGGRITLADVQDYNDK